MIAVCHACKKGAWLHCIQAAPEGLRIEAARVSRLSRLPELRGSPH